MSKFARAHDRYLDPPDEPEACEYCGRDVERIQWSKNEYGCTWAYCPSKSPEGTKERELAEMLVAAYDTIDGLRKRINRRKNELRP